MEFIGVFIYSLSDPDTRLVRYIGKGKDPANRLSVHLWQARKGVKSHKCNWLRSLLSSGERPGLSVIEECDGDGWKEERYHIKLAKADGLKLTNHTDGGEGQTGMTFSPEHRARISAAHRGKILSRETREKVGKGSRAVWNHPGYRERMSAIHKAIGPHPGTGRKVSLALKGRKQTPEFIAKRAAGIRKAYTRKLASRRHSTIQPTLFPA